MYVTLTALLESIIPFTRNQATYFAPNNYGSVTLYTFILPAYQQFLMVN